MILRKTNDTYTKNLVESGLLYVYGFMDTEMFT